MSSLDTRGVLIPGNNVFDGFPQGRADVAPDHGRGTFHATHLRHGQNAAGLRVRTGTRHGRGLCARVLDWRTGREPHGSCVDGRVRVHGELRSIETGMSFKSQENQEETSGWQRESQERQRHCCRRQWVSFVGSEDQKGKFPGQRRINGVRRGWEGSSPHFWNFTFFAYACSIHSIAVMPNFFSPVDQFGK